MEILKIKDIKPIDCVINIFDEEFTLRKFSFLDQNWIEESFTPEEKATLFNDRMKDTALARIVFHQMTLESQARVLPFTVKFINEDTGEETEKTYKGWRALLGRLAGIPDKTEAYRGVLTVIGLSQPQLEKMFTPEELTNLGLNQDGTVEKKKKPKARSGRK